MTNNMEALLKINKTAKAYKQSLIVLAANELGIYDTLKSNKYTALELSKKMKLKLRGLTILLNALVQTGFIIKKGDKYFNVKSFEQYLVKGGKHYVGSSLRHDFNLVHSWYQLPDVLKSGKPARKEKRTKKEQENFILAMANSSELRINDFFDNVDFGKCNKFLDVGGGPGTFSLNAVRRYQNLTAYNFDLPETLSIAKKYLASFREKDRIKLVKGDYFKDGLGKDFDVILLSNIIHSIGEKDTLYLFKKTYSSLADNGKLIVKDFFINENRIEPQRAVLFAVNMLVNTSEGCAYSVRETTTLLKKTGFRKIKYVFVNDEVEFIEAYK